MMDFVFVFCIPWIVVSNARCRNFVNISCTISCILLFLWTCVLATEESETVNKEFLIKSSKVIEAYPHILRRSGSGLPDDWDCALVGACEDPVGYEAIRGLHRQLDDDANGSIDVAETDEFLRDELQYENGRHKERHKEFHGNDKYINVDELWQAWKTSEVHNWTVEQTVEWLINQVELPQYEHNFRNNGVNGASLPLLAQNTHNFISQNLGIKDSISKQKIALKAMDVVLFGPPKYHNFLKDVLLGMSLVIAVGGCWFAYVQHKHSQTHMLKMMKDMEALQKAEDSLSDLQRELNKAKHEQELVSSEKQDLERRLQDEITTAKRCLEQSTSLPEGGSDSPGERLLDLERELQLARSELREAEKKLEARQWVAPTALQHWLQLTHELELRSHNAKRAVAEQQLQAAKEGCEKLSKKRATFMGAFRIAHGSSIDDVDDRIVKAKSALYEVTTDLQERMNRWKQIEVLCGVPIIVNAGLTQLEGILKPKKLTGSTHSGLNILSKSNSDSTLREESPPPSYPGIVSTCSTKPVDRHSSFKKRFLVHRDSGISLTSSAPPMKMGSSSNIPPPLSKQSPVFPRNPPSPVLSRVVYPKECYRPSVDPQPADCATDSEMDSMEVVEERAERSVTPTSLASCSQENSLAADGLSDTISERLLPTEPSSSTNGKMGDFVRKISAGLLDRRKKPPATHSIEVLRKSRSSSNILGGGEDGSSESSSSVVSEEKKKKKFFQTLRHRKPKVQ